MAPAQFRKPCLLIAVISSGMSVKLPASGVTHHYFLPPSRPFPWHWQVPGAEPASQKLPVLCGDELLNSSNKLLGINIISLKF